VNGGLGDGTGGGAFGLGHGHDPRSSGSIPSFLAPVKKANVTFNDGKARRNQTKALVAQRFWPDCS
jgi:hypothetical protein